MTTPWPLLKSIRAARLDGAPIYVIMDNLSANKTPAIRAWASKHKVRLVHAHERLLGQPDRGAFRAIAHLLLWAARTIRTTPC